MSEGNNENVSCFNIKFDDFAKEIGVEITEGTVIVSKNLDPVLFKLFCLHYEQQVNIMGNINFALEKIFSEIESCKNIEEVKIKCLRLKEIFVNQD